MNAGVRVALFDLDRTITRSGTYTPFLLGWAARHQPWRLLTAPLVALAMLGYTAKLLDRTALKLLMLKLFVGKVRRDRLQEAADAFAARVIARASNGETLAEIKRLQGEGVLIAIATASFDWCAAAFARQLGLTGAIATRACWEGDRMLPAIHGANCYGEEKLRMIEAGFAGLFGLPRAQARVTFYTDHHSDLPSLLWADDRVMVRPTLKLRRIAPRYGFRLLA